MWRLQPNVQYTKRRFFKEIVLFVIACHVFVFLLFIFVYNKAQHKPKFTISQKHTYSTIVLLPLHKKVVAPFQKSSTHAVDNSRTLKKVISYQDYQKKRKAKQQRDIARKQKATAKKINSKKQLSKKSVVSKQVKKVDPKKAAVRTSVKKSVVKKTTGTMLKQEKKDFTKQVTKSVKKVPEKKKEIVKKQMQSDEKKDVAVKQVKPEVVEVKKIEQKVEALKKEAEVPQVEKAEKPEIEKSVEVLPEVKEPVQEPVASLQEDVSLEEKFAEDIDTEHVTFVGRQDLEMIHMQEQIQVEVAKYWKPPIGIAKDAVCEVSVSVDTQGQAGNIRIVKSSGSFANDVCARAALLQVSYPKEIWGKEFTISLGQ